MRERGLNQLKSVIMKTRRHYSYYCCSMTGCPTEGDRGYEISCGICLFVVCEKCKNKLRRKRRKYSKQCLASQHAEEKIADKIAC
jgi:hypothetical protein